MQLTEIASDDILVFEDEVRIDENYAINGMFGLEVFVIDNDGEVEEQIPIDDLEEHLKSKVLDIISNDRFELSRNE